MKQIEEKIASVKDYLLSLQNNICHALAEEDGKAEFIEDIWTYSSGSGSGCTRTIADGEVIEKGAVNFSHIRGSQLPPTACKRHPQLVGQPFQALGVSLVIHPINPFVPTVHMNLRFFIAEQPGSPIWWFGGGFDLTPYYGFEEDCRHWHQNAKKACDQFGIELYPQFKKACDDYFYLPHRKEPRGIGGLFFDDFNQYPFEHCFDLIKTIGNCFLTGYQPIVARRKQHLFTQQHRDFQNYRRGRYVEFNLLYDRGTLFGLQSGGRTESILVSMPPQVSWQYNWSPAENSEESKLYKEFLIIRDWV